jgi:hypothetical protein
MTSLVLQATGLEPRTTGLAPCHPVRAFEFDQVFVNSVPVPSRFWVAARPLLRYYPCRPDLAWPRRIRSRRSL